MVHIFIPNKQSERFPNKNSKLLSYTASWLERAVPLLDESFRIYFVGEHIPNIPASWCYLPAEVEKGHLHVLQSAEQSVNPGSADVCVQTQLTQPLREDDLLRRAVALCRSTGRTVVSATEMPDPTWRRLDSSGAWSAKKLSCHVPFYDGRIYAWLPGHVAEIFDSRCPHAVVYSVFPFIVDVDRPEDLPSELVSILEAEKRVGQGTVQE